MNDLFKQPIIITTWVFVLLFVLLRYGPTVPFSVTTQQRGEPFVSSGVGKATEAPDIASLSLGITERGQSLATAQASVNKKSQELVNALKNIGVEEKDIKTTSYRVSPDYDYRSEPAQITGYSISIDYSVQVREIDNVSDVLNEATAVDANNISGVSLGFSDDKKAELLDKARKEAIREAKEKGESLASLSGLSLGRIINVSEGYSAIPYASRNLAFEDSATLELAPQAAIEPGESEISTTVTITWEVR